MAKGVCGSVQGIGITPTTGLVNPKIFTQIAIPETVKIPHPKPDAEELISVAIDAEVISTRLVKTPVGTSLEGQYLSGHKLIVELKLKQKIKYVADEPTQSVHAAHFEKVISSIFVVVPDNIVVGPPPVAVPIQQLFDEGRLIITPYIEDIYAVLKDKRTIFKNIVVLVNVTAV